MTTPVQESGSAAKPEASTRPIIVSGEHSGETRVVERKPYLAMATVMIGSIDQFLQPFQSASDPALRLNMVTREEFFPRFFHLANRLADDCSQRMAKLILTFSTLPPVRETSAAFLAKRIRETGFQSLDPILASYLAAAKKIAVIYSNIRKISEELERGALVGAARRETTSETDREKATPERWASPEELARQHESLLKAQAQAFTRIAEYLNKITDMPGRVLAYACGKCFGGEVNLALEQEQVAGILAEIQPKLRAALETLAGVNATAKRDVEEDRRGILANIEVRMNDAMLAQIWEEKLEAKQATQAKWKHLSVIGLWFVLIVTALVLGVILFLKSVGLG